MQSYILFVIHSVAIMLLARMLWAASKAYNVPITIHNLPIVILTGLGLGLATWIAMFHLLWFIPTGLLCAGLVFTLNSVEMPGHPNPSLFKKLIVATISAAFWPELIVFCWFYFAHAKKIDADEKPES
jgi:hypothetical protein